ncbi:hypothetical protein [Dyella acidiphila]|uniref:Uncharacterized protein n=1 Tax=Dyella acidiphila TaxID=2775866 RepID=A0ABR9GBE7_9GAMM|nr:hypothetical protein [Dyella acidiphila]MBE1161319.1 hypothetical protein [Dyella acidiphila]
MPCADIFLVYDLLGTAIARGRLDVAHYAKEGGYGRSDILSCLCMLWRECLIESPVVNFAVDQDSVISLDHGASDYGRSMHRLLRETLLMSPEFRSLRENASEPAAAPAFPSRGLGCNDGGKIRVVR